MANFFLIDKENVRLDNLLCERLPQFTRSHIKQMIDAGKVTLNGKVVKAGAKGKIGDRVDYQIDEVKPLEVKAENVEYEVVFEDEDLLVINKPQGV